MIHSRELKLSVFIIFASQTRSAYMHARPIHTNTYKATSANIVMERDDMPSEQLFGIGKHRDVQEVPEHIKKRKKNIKPAQSIANSKILTKPPDSNK